MKIKKIYIFFVGVLKERLFLLSGFRTKEKQNIKLLKME